MDFVDLKDSESSSGTSAVSDSSSDNESISQDEMSYNSSKVVSLPPIVDALPVSTTNEYSKEKMAIDSKGYNQKKSLTVLNFSEKITKEECRGSKELSLMYPNINSSRPKEVEEKDIPSYYNDTETEDDNLRLLDEFFFCDPKGKPISLDVLELPHDQRPEIMAFGTIIEWLPIEERPSPLPYVATSIAPNQKRRHSTGKKSSTKQKRRKSSPKNSGIDMNDPQPSLIKNTYSEDKVNHQEKESGINNVDSKLNISTEKSNVLLNPSNEKSHGEENINQVELSINSSEIIIESNQPPVTIPQYDGNDSDSNDHISTSTKSSHIFQSTHIYNYNRERMTNLKNNDIPQLDGIFPGDSDKESSSSDNEVKDCSSSSVSSSISSRDRDGNSSVEEIKEENVELNPNQVNIKSMATKDSIKDIFCPVITSPKKKKDKKVFQEITTTTSMFHAEEMVTEDLKILESGFIHPKSCRRMRVFLSKITDWCLDYSSGDPTLWVITDFAWYKIAGPISGVFPHLSYRKYFKSARMMFEACYRVAFVLREWLPFNKKLSYQATLREIVAQSAQSAYPLTADFLVQQYQFIKSQIEDLDKDDPTRVSSMFFRQLQRLNEFYERRKKKEIEKKERMLERQIQCLQEKEERLKKKEEERKNQIKEREALRLLREKKRLEADKYPMEDLELLEELGGESKVPSRPASSGHLLFPENLLGDTIMIWQTLITFHKYLQLSTISLENLCNALEFQDGPCLLLNEIFLALLRAILDEKKIQPNFTKEELELFGNTKRIYGLKEIKIQDHLGHVSWQEILRQLMALDSNFGYQVGMIDPLEACEVVCQTIYMQNNSTPFLAPVQAEALGLDEYTEIIKDPMDIGTVQKRLKEGYYEKNDSMIPFYMNDYDQESIQLGHEIFEKDMRRIWSNAILFNGEDSSIGQAASSLSDLFDQEFNRLVSSPTKKCLIHYNGLKSMKKKLLDADYCLKVKSKPPQELNDVIYGLHMEEFYKLPLGIKVAALTWTCAEFMKLSNIRSIVDQDNRRYYEIYKESRQIDRTDDQDRKEAEKARQEREIEHRRKMIEEKVDEDEMNDKEFTEFFSVLESIRLEREAENLEYEKRKEARDQKLNIEINRLSVRTQPIGLDRYLDRYWIFPNDPIGRLFIESSETGSFYVYDQIDDVKKIIEWLNPKGKRELKLRNTLLELKNEIIQKMEQNNSSKQSTHLAFLSYNNSKTKFSQQIDTVHLGMNFGPEFKSFELISQKHLSIFDIKRIMKGQIEHIGYAYLSNRYAKAQLKEQSDQLLQQILSADSLNHMRDSLLQMEEMMELKARDIFLSTWSRKRRQWQFGLKNCCTFSQLYLYIHMFGENSFNEIAWNDFSEDWDRKSWMTLRPKECRACIPEEGDTVVYFAKGHEQANQIEAALRFFTWKGDKALSETKLCYVQGISYHSGDGGNDADDPYARVHLSVIKEEDSELKLPPASRLCSQEMNVERLNRLLLCIFTKAKNNETISLSSGSDNDSTYITKEIKSHYTKIMENMKSCTYKSLGEVLSELALVVEQVDAQDVSHSFLKSCQRIFDNYKKISRNYPQIEQLEQDIKNNVKSSSSDSFQSSLEKNYLSSSSSSSSCCIDSFTVVLRLENRLPEFIVNRKTYRNLILNQDLYYPGVTCNLLYRDLHGYPTVQCKGILIGSLPVESNGYLPWDSLTIAWDDNGNEVDMGEELQLNPWEIKLLDEPKTKSKSVHTTRRSRR